MTNFICVPKRDAEKVRNIIHEKSLWVLGYKTERDEKFVYFPIIDKNDPELKKYKRISRKGKNYPKTQSLKSILTEKFKIKDYIASYDTVGDIAILKYTPEMEKKEKEIAKVFLQTNPIIKTVVKKTEAHHGKYRIEGVKYVAGKKTLNTIVKENNCVFKVELGEMFFSTRLSFERERVAKMVKDGSNVAIFFAGVGPFSIIIGKQKPNCKIYSIELNRTAHKMAKENIKLNQMKNVKAICANVTKYTEKIKDSCDYVIMPLPKTANLFLESAYTAIKKGSKSGIISLYKFVPKDKPYIGLINELKTFAKKKKRKLKVVFKRIVRPYSAGIVQVVIDFCFIK